MIYPMQNISILIDVCWLTFLAVWIASAADTKRNLYKRQNRLIRILFVVLIIAAVSIAAKLAPRASIIAYTKITQIFGVALTAFGIGWAIWARSILGANWSAYPTVKENHDLVQTGPYAITRHPIYTGTLVAFLGNFLAVLPTIIGLLLVLVGIVWLVFRVGKEEKLMTQTFPAAYLSYKQKVRFALIPFIF